MNEGIAKADSNESNEENTRNRQRTRQGEDAKVGRYYTGIMGG